MIIIVFRFGPWPPSGTLAAGALLVFFALVGWRAAYTNNPMVAKVFMMAFPATLSVRIAHLVLSPHQTLSVGLLVLMVTFAYFFKVSYW